MSRQRSWLPTGELVPSSQVSVIRRKVKGAREPFKVICRLGGTDRTSAFARSGAADEFERELGCAALFDAGSHLPASWSLASAVTAPSTLDFALRYAAQCAVDDKPKTKASRAEAMRLVCMELVTPGPAPVPGWEYRWEWLREAFKPDRVPGVRGHEERLRAVAEARAERLSQLKPEVRAAGDWLSEHSLPVNEITTKLTDQVLTSIKTNPVKGTPAAATVRNRKRQVLHHFLEALVVAEHLAVNPMDALGQRPRRFSSAKVRSVDRSIVMNPVQAEAFIANIGRGAMTRNGIRQIVEDPEDARYTPFFQLMLNEGPRPSEAAAVREDWLTLPEKGWGTLRLEGAMVATGAAWSDVGEPIDENPLKWTDDPGDETDLRRRKTRRIPLSPETVAALRQSLEEFGAGPDGRLFWAREGDPMNPSVIARLVRKARDLTFADPEHPSTSPERTTHCGRSPRTPSGTPLRPRC